MSPKTYLIIGATGTQGSSVITSLLSSASEEITIYALTRSPTSSRSKSLSALSPQVHLLKGDPSSPTEIFTSAPTPINSIFIVTVHGPTGFEESQASGLISAAIAHGVSHIVFTSADRGGAEVSETNPSPVPHIASKYRIEKDLKAQCAAAPSSNPVQWTILRPVTFMDNLTPDFAGKGFAAMWRQVGSKPVQLVAASDIGFFAAKALLHPDAYAGRAIGIAGDELNYEQACEVFKEKMGVDMPSTFCAVGSVLKVAMRDIGSMFKWFEKDGYAVDIEAARRENPGLKDFGTWLVDGSEFKKGAKGTE